MNKLEEVKKQIEETFEKLAKSENDLLMSKNDAQLIAAEYRLDGLKEFYKVHGNEMPSLLKYVNEKIEEKAKLKQYSLKVSIGELRGILSNKLPEIYSISLMRRLIDCLISKGFDVEILGRDEIQEYNIHEFCYEKCKYLKIQWWQDDPK